MRCTARDPTTEITCLGTEQGLETSLVPARGYQLALIPEVKFPASSIPDCSGCPAGCAGPSRPPARCWSSNAGSK